MKCNLCGTVGHNRKYHGKAVGIYLILTLNSCFLINCVIQLINFVSWMLDNKGSTNKHQYGDWNEVGEDNFIDAINS